MTSLSYDMKAAVEQSKDNLIPSCISENNTNYRKIRICMTLPTKFHGTFFNLSEYKHTLV